MISLSVIRDDWPLREPFVIAGSTTTAITTVTVELAVGDDVGRGEALGVDYLGETADSIEAQIEEVRSLVEEGRRSARSGAVATPELDALAVALGERLPAGGARNALDCALWDLRLALTGTTIWQTLGLDPRPVVTAYTLSLDHPAAMATAAQRAAAYPVLKLKLDAVDPAARLAAVRAARPDAELLVDANGSWTAGLLADLAPELAACRVALVEQPLPVGEDAALAELALPVPVCADESCQSSADLSGLVGRYQAVNLKLDKCGGLTEALSMVRLCRELGLELMVGNMLGSSLAMAPAFVIAQHCRFVDLDGPLLQVADRTPAIRYEGARMWPPAPGLWG